MKKVKPEENAILNLIDKVDQSENPILNLSENDDQWERLRKISQFLKARKKMGLAKKEKKPKVLDSLFTAFKITQFILEAREKMGYEEKEKKPKIFD